MKEKQGFQKMCSTYWLMPFLFLVFSSSVYAQTGNIKGKVLKKSNGDALYNATVKISGTSKTTLTDSKGEYIFNGLEADKNYTLQMTKDPLYEDGQTTVNVKANVTAEAADVELVRKPPNAKIIRVLTSLLDRRKFDEFEEALNVLSELCEGEDDEYCRTIKDIDEQFDRRNLRAVKEKLNALTDKLEREPAIR